MTRKTKLSRFFLHTVLLLLIAIGIYYIEKGVSDNLGAMVLVGTIALLPPVTVYLIKWNDSIRDAEIDVEYALEEEAYKRMDELAEGVYILEELVELKFYKMQYDYKANNYYENKKVELWDRAFKYFDEDKSYIISEDPES